jgi:hypothetical protein
MSVVQNVSGEANLSTKFECQKIFIIISKYFCKLSDLVSGNISFVDNKVGR